MKSIALALLLTSLSSLQPLVAQAPPASGGAVFVAYYWRARPGKVEEYKFTLPNVDHVFLPGHRIMVQVQSSLFPLYDRNPQSFVANIFNAKAGDYRKATQSVFFGGNNASAVYLPVVP